MGKKRVLAVDDAPENLALIIAILKEGYTMSVATNGQKALQMAASLKPDLILLDVLMPEMDGFEVCRALKENESTKKIPIVFVTSNANMQEIDKMLKAGGADCISKPIEPQTLKNAIAKQFAKEEI